MAEQGRVILAIDGLQPDVGHEVLWVVRDCLSGEVLLARSLLSATQDDLARLLKEVTAALPVSVVGVISDGQHSIRKAVARAFPGYPTGWPLPLLERSGHAHLRCRWDAKKELKKRVRGVRPLERQVESREDELGHITRDYCQTIRSALTDDGLPPLDAAGLRLRRRLRLIAHSLERAEKRGASPGAGEAASDISACSTRDRNLVGAHRGRF